MAKVYSRRDNKKIALGGDAKMRYSDVFFPFFQRTPT